MTTPKEDKFRSFIQSTHNFLIVKDSMGKAKPCTFQLPDSSFTYGRPVKNNREGVGDLISSWREHKPSVLNQPDKDFKRLNKLSVIEGVHTASDQRKFRNKSNLRIRPFSHRSQESIPDLIFGDPARPSTPLKAVLGHLYGNQAADQVTSNYTPKSRRRLSVSKGTLGSEKRNQWIRKSMQIDHKDLFKLKKFLAVKPRTSTKR